MPVPARSRTRGARASARGRLLTLLSGLGGSRTVLVEPGDVGSRPVLLALVRRPPQGSYLVVSWRGARAAWLRAVRSRERVRVAVGGAEPVPARARVLARAETATVLRPFPVVELVPDFGG